MARILIVDDRPINRRYLVQVLALDGHHTLEAGDGAQALALAREHRPGLVITDIMMPVADGFELTRSLRADPDPDLAATPVVFYTATYRSADAERLAESLGVNAVLTKPSGPKLVLQTVNRALGPATPDATEPRRRLAAVVPTVQRSAARLFALLELSLDLAVERDRAAFLRMYCDAGRRIVDAGVTALVLLDEAGEVRLVEALGLSGGGLHGPAMRDGLVGQVWQRDDALRAGDGHTPLAGLPPAFHAASFLGVPVCAGAGCRGALVFGRPPGVPVFNDEDEMLALALAAEFTVLFELFEAHEAVQRHAVELHAEVEQRRRAEIEMAGFARRLLDQEKDTTRRLAQSLHDDLGQTLAAMGLMLDTLSSRPDGSAARPDMLKVLNNLAADANRQVREVLIDLRPPLLDEEGLAAALDNELRQRTTRVDGVSLRMEAAPAMHRLRWPPQVEYAAFMIAREGLSNALRHAQASTVWVALDGDARRLVLAVRDNGRGLPEGGAKTRPGHLGMVGMRERALAIEARLEIHSAPEMGTVVKLLWEGQAGEAVPG